MRFFLCLLFVLTSVAISPVAHADQNDPMLNDLFDELRSGAENPERIQNDIETRWMSAPEIGVQVLVGRLVVALEAEDMAVSSVLANHITGLAPSFAEGWMLMGHVAVIEEDAAAAEIYFSRALALEPRHYHALASLGDLAHMADDYEDAFRFYRQALDINPYLSDVREKADQIQFELGSREI